MCGEHHHGGRGHGFRFRGRHGFPNREELVERLQGYQQRLEEELANVKDVIERLSDPGAEPTTQG